MIINENICGWGNTCSLVNLAKYAKQVPENGTIVELGTFAGRSAYALGMNKKDSVHLYCYDWFGDPCNPRTLASFQQDSLLHNADTDQIYCVETVRENLQDVKNLHLVKAVLPLAVEEMTFEDESVDFIYIDAGHTYDQTKSNINQWYPKIKKGGVLYFDDYSEENWPGVYKAVNRFCMIHNEHLNVFMGRQAIIIKRA